MKRTSSAVWNGTGKEGTGKVSSTSGVLQDTPYSFATRFVSEDGKAGTNPEELIAAAHAACFNMALSFQLTGSEFPPTELKTEATLTLETEGSHFVIKTIHLDLHGTVPNITAEKFSELANVAKENCPVSKALSSVEITLTATLQA